MLEFLHKSFLMIHIPAGFLSLILFWIPVGLPKGSSMHKKVGWYYYFAMWIVLGSAAALSICNLLLARYDAAMFLGYLAIITAYPLWYSFEILRQDREWTNRYFMIRRAFVLVMFVAALSIFLLAAIRYQFKGMGTTMAFFGLLGIPAARDLFMTKAKAMDRENKLQMHIKGTIISGIAAYTAFFAFGGSRLLIEVLHVHHQWMFIPWTLPTVLGLMYMRFMKRRYRVA